MAKQNAERRPRPEPDAPTPWYDRVPWLALAVSLAVILSSGFAVQPIRDAATGGDIAEAYLLRPMGYVLLAPASSVLDTLTLISVRQHVALLAGALVLFALWRVYRSMRTAMTWRSHALASTAFVVAIVGVYAAGALLPRPMASLETDNANILRVDFHSHTSASHDGRQSVEGNREWHRRAGFNVAYITDHGTVAGAERAVATNPRAAGEGVTLLQAIEATWSGEHVSILGAQRTYSGLLTQNLRDVDTLGLRLGSIIPSREPVVIWNHPHVLDRLPIADGAGTPGIRAIEIVNGAPDDMDENRRQRAQLLALAQQKNLALTVGTDNHGWGRAAPGWTLMRIFNWRSLSPDALALQIEAVLRGGGFESTRVVERRVADSNAMVWASVLTVPGRMLSTLSNDERVAWLIWTWLLTGGAWLWRRRRASA